MRGGEESGGAWRVASASTKRAKEGTGRASGRQASSGRAVCASASKPEVIIGARAATWLCGDGQRRRPGQR